MRNDFRDTSTGISRRAFLGKGGLALGGLGLLTAWAGTDVVGAAQPTALPPMKMVDLLPWKELQVRMSGGVLRAGQAGYAKAASPWNLRYADRLPAGIARCRRPEDVAEAFSWASSVGLAVAVRGGGHSSAGYSNTRGLQVDLSEMAAVSYSQESHLLTVGGGVRFSQLREELEPYGRGVALPRFAALGVAGTVLGGGLSPDMRQRGLLCDQLHGVELVTPQGEVLNCDRQHHTDLFWAVRGAGGGQLGAVTSLTLKTFPSEDLTVFELEWDTDLEDLFPALMSLLPEASEGLGAELSLRVRAGHTLVLSLKGQLQGDPQEFTDLLSAVCQIASPRQRSVDTLPFWEAKARLADNPQPAAQAHTTRYLYQEMALQACDSVVARMRAWPGTSGQASWTALLLGKAVDNLGRRHTAYVHRGAKFLALSGVSWGVNDAQPRVQASLAWLEALHRELEPYGSPECSQNWPDPTLPQLASAYYGENLDYLTAQREDVDPRDLLAFPQTDSRRSDISASG